MLAEQHIRTGVIGGLALLALGSNALGVARLTDLLILPAVAGGAALLPDWDHRGSTVTRALPIITVPIFWLVTWTHRAVYAATRRGLDPPTRSGRRWRTAHRGLTHSVFMGIAAIPIIATVLYVSHPLVAVVVVAALVALAGDVVFAPVLAIVYAVAGLHEFGSVLIFIEYIHSLSWLWAVAIGIGLVMHCLGDCPTTQGAPLWAPVSWEPVTLPFSFKTGGWFEMRVLRIAFIVAILYLQFVLHVGWVGQIVAALLDGAG